MITESERAIYARYHEVSAGAELSNCMKCGKCSGSCPAYAEMAYHPHEYVVMAERGRLGELIASGAHLKCASCFTCSERCPRSVDPARLIEAIRVLDIRRSGENKLKASDVPPLLDEDMPQQAITSAFRKYDR